MIAKKVKESTFKDSFRTTHVYAVYQCPLGERHWYWRCSIDSNVKRRWIFCKNCCYCIGLAVTCVLILMYAFL